MVERGKASAHVAHNLTEDDATESDAGFGVACEGFDTAGAGTGLGLGWGTGTGLGNGSSAAGPLPVMHCQ